MIDESSAAAEELARLRLLRRAKDLMDRSWSEPIDLNAVAARAGYSRFHFIRLFKQAYGETPGQYLSRRRVERSQELLRSANLTVTEICVAVGFESLGSFCTRFKQVTGLTPTKFRETELRGRPAPIPGCFVLLWANGFRVPDSAERVEQDAAPDATFKKADRGAGS